MKKIICALALSLAITSCGNNSSNNESSSTATDTTQTTQAEPDANPAQALQGTFSGKMPCTDCKGILVMLSISANGNCGYSEKRLGDDRDKGTNTPGRWEADWNAGIITMKFGPAGEEVKTVKVVDNSKVVLMSANGQALNEGQGFELVKQTGAKIENGNAVVAPTAPINK